MHFADIPESSPLQLPFVVFLVPMGRALVRVCVRRREKKGPGARRWPFFLQVFFEILGPDGISSPRRAIHELQGRPDVGRMPRLLHNFECIFQRLSSSD